MCGQTIAAVGNNGATTGPHLHFQLMDNTNFDMAEGVPTGSPHSCSSDTSTRRRASSCFRRPSPTPNNYL
jgi:murein DD-endopeptidase MepM/ murein hydrolase activator NlpD